MSQHMQSGLKSFLKPGFKNILVNATLLNQINYLAAHSKL